MPTRPPPSSWIPSIATSLNSPGRAGHRPRAPHGGHRGECPEQGGRLARRLPAPAARLPIAQPMLAFPPRLPGQASRGRPALAGCPPPQRRWRSSFLCAPLLVRYLIQTRQRTRGRAIEWVPQSVMQALVAADWPGNLRELKNVVERALILSPGPVLRLEETLEQIPRARIQGRGSRRPGRSRTPSARTSCGSSSAATGRSRARARRSNGYEASSQARCAPDKAPSDPPAGTAVLIALQANCP